MKLQDGTGKNYWARINSNNQLETSSVIVTEEHYVNHVYGKAFNILWDFSVSTGNDRAAIYVKNTGITTIVFEGFNYQGSADMEFYAHWDTDGTPVGGTPMVIGNLNAGSADLLNVTALTGDGMTGLSGGRLFYRGKVMGSQQSQFANFDADLILPPQHNLTVYVSSSAGFSLMGFLVCYEDVGGI